MKISHHFIELYRERDNYIAEYAGKVGTVTGHSPLYGCWLVRYETDADPQMRHHFTSSWLTVVVEPAPEPPPQKLLHLVRGEL